MVAFIYTWVNKAIQTDLLEPTGSRSRRCELVWTTAALDLTECIFENPKTKYTTLGPKFFYSNKMTTARRPMDLFEI